MNVKIACDSAADLFPYEITDHDIHCFPLIIIKDDKEYYDGETISAIEVFDQMREEAVFHTAQITFTTFYEHFEKMAQEGRPCLYIAFSSELSGTYSTSVLARDEILNNYPDARIEVLDSKCASGGCGLVILKAAEMAKKGYSIDEIIQYITAYAAQIVHIFTPEKLEYLFRGGRVSKTSAFVGDALGIRPLCYVDDGKLIPLYKVRGEKKLFAKMLEMLHEFAGEDVSEQIITLTHADAKDSIEKLQRYLEEHITCKGYRVTELGPTIGCHVGPGTICIFAEGKDTPKLP